MNIQHPTDDERLAELAAYAEAFPGLDRAIEEANEAISAATEAVDDLRIMCEDYRDAIDAAGDPKADAVSERGLKVIVELDDIHSGIVRVRYSLEDVWLPNTFRSRVATLRRTLEQERTSSTAVNQG
jgi:hypothetical protein